MNFWKNGKTLKNRFHFWGFIPTCLRYRFLAPKRFKEHTMESLLRLPEVERRTGLKRSAIYNRMATGEFPKPIRLTEKAVAWPESEVSHWIHAKIAQGRLAAAA
jgi:prophage regulatory protein